MAEWLRANRPRWKRVYVLKDTYLEYSTSATDYFVARWKQLGGTISGEDTIAGLPCNPGYLGAHIGLLRAKVAQTDVIYDGSFLWCGADAIARIRADHIGLPVATDSAVEGKLLLHEAGRVSNVYGMASLCIPTYCSGAVTPAVRRFFNEFRKKYGVTPSNSYAARGYDLATALFAAIRRAHSTDGPKVAKALFSGMTISTLSGPVRFSGRCHRPQPASHVFELYTNGRARALGRVYARDIPDLGDGNPCAGPQAGG